MTPVIQPGEKKLSLLASVNPATVATGEMLAASVGVTNPGLPGAADFYLGILLPGGSTAVFFTAAGGITLGDIADTGSFRPIASGVPLGTPFSASVPNFLSYGWTGGEPHGAYVFFFVALQAGALTDGLLSSEDLLGVATANFAFP
jgi:hypothetical protein